MSGDAPRCEDCGGGLQHVIDLLHVYDMKCTACLMDVADWITREVRRRGREARA